MITLELIGETEMALTEKYRDFTLNDPNLDRMQSFIKSYLQQFDDLSFLNGVFVNNVTVTTSSTSIDHKLGRQPIGWIITDKNALADVYRVSWNDRVIILDSSATVTLNMWVF